MTNPAVLIKGEVRDARGRPAALARVAFVDGPGPLQDVSMLTGADGTFTLSAPIPGVYTVAVYADDCAPLITSVTATAGQAVRLQLTLQPA